MKTSFEKADFVLRLLTFAAIVIGGGWTAYQYKQTGSADWAINMRLETEILPYRDDLRLLVVHVRSKNPRNYVFELNRDSKDSFELRFHKISSDLKANVILDEENGQLIGKADLMQGTGGGYAFLPNAEMDDMRYIVLPINTVVEITAEMQIHNGDAGACT